MQLEEKKPVRLTASRRRCSSSSCLHRSCSRFPSASLRLPSSVQKPLAMASRGMVLNRLVYNFAITTGSRMKDVNSWHRAIVSEVGSQFLKARPTHVVDLMEEVWVTCAKRMGLCRNMLCLEGRLRNPGF